MGFCRRSLIKYYQIQIHSGKFFCTEYEKSKAFADKVALDAASEGMPIVPVYPGVIYGPGKVTAGNVVARMVHISTFFLLLWLKVLLPVW